MVPYTNDGDIRELHVCYYALQLNTPLSGIVITKEYFNQHNARDDRSGPVGAEDMGQAVRLLPTGRVS